MDEKKEYPAYIVCFTMRVPKLDPEPFTVPYVDIDTWVVFNGTTEQGATPIVQANYYVKKLKQNPNLYTWNIAKVLKTSEHYKTSK